MSFDPNKITFFAETDARGKNTRFGIKAKDRQRHMYVIGKTGMGKSTLLENMAVQDIQNGEGMAFIDPHGSAAETLLNYIPEHRMNDVLYFSPADASFPVSFNIMEDVGPDKRHLVVSGLMSVFKKIWIDAWSARMEYILSNTLLALLEYPGSTLLGVNRMLSDKDYRKVVVDNVKDPGVKAFWVDEFAKYNERYMQEAGDAIKNKIGQFTANPIIRNIIGQPKSSFDIRKMMDEKKILIMNLSKGLIGESNANLLGSMLTTRIYLAAMSRADLSPEKMREMPNFYFFVDEFQSFANATFANILSEARKYHLNLTIAHQYITQMEEEVRDAVFGNVGTIIAFRVGPLDAELLETIFTPQFLAADIVNLSFAQVYLTLMIDGIGSQPFSAKTLSPIEPPSSSCKEMAIAESRLRFTRPRADVEIEIHKFHEPVVLPKKVTKPIIPVAVIAAGEAVVAQAEKESAPQLQSQHRASVSASAPVQRTSVAVPRVEQSHGVPKAPTPALERRSEVPQRRSTDPGRQTRVVERPRADAPKPASSPSSSGARTVAPVRREPPKQSAEDLKSILKRIVETAEEGSQKEKEQKKHTEKAELKQAITTVVPQKEPEVVAPIEVPVEVPKPQAEAVPIVPAHSEPVAQPKPVTESRQPPSTISAKELERMMRVTTSDKPPV